MQIEVTNTSRQYTIKVSDIELDLIRYGLGGQDSQLAEDLHEQIELAQRP